MNLRNNYEKISFALPKYGSSQYFFRYFGSFSIRKGRFCGRAEGGFGGNSALQIRSTSLRTGFGRNLFEFFRTHTADLENLDRRVWRYSSFMRFLFSSKTILNCLKKVSRPSKLKETRYSREKTTGQNNFLPAISRFNSWIYPLILPPTPPK